MQAYRVQRCGLPLLILYYVTQTLFFVLNFEATFRKLLSVPIPEYSDWFYRFGGKREILYLNN
jgi:hypothetical protein